MGGVAAVSVVGVLAQGEYSGFGGPYVVVKPHGADTAAALVNVGPYGDGY